MCPMIRIMHWACEDLDLNLGQLLGACIGHFSNPAPAEIADGFYCKSSNERPNVTLTKPLRIAVTYFWHCNLS